MKLAMKEQIRIARDAKGFTQAELAVALGITVASIQHWEAGRNVPKGGGTRNLSAC